MNSLFGDDVPPTQPAATPFAPLAARMRPRVLDEVIGQDDVIGADRPLRRAVASGALPSLILWGPPGAGKTTLAEILAAGGKATFVRLSAVSAGVADLRRVVDDAARAVKAQRRTVVFIDEIHRFNRAQQDVILPHVENGTITLIGATTENPSFEVNAALLSRARVVVLKALSDADIVCILQNALHDPERGYGNLVISCDDDALQTIAGFANGDARTALNTLEFAVQSSPQSDDGQILRTADIVDALARRMTRHDKSGEAHFDTISAFIKSMRANDPDAAIYWLTRMLDGGEDPLFIARRIIIFASEDIGLADSAALPLAVAAAQTVHMIGMPEAHYALSHATLYCATAAKSRRVGNAYDAALADVRGQRQEAVPLHLRNAPTELMRNLGYGKKSSDGNERNVPDNIPDAAYFARND